MRFDRDASLEIDVDDILAANGFPFPHPKSRRITQADFPAIIGGGHDQPVE